VKRLIFVFFLFFTFTVNAAYLDDDMDGVENGDDLCPNSALTDIVDERGCVVEKLTFKQEHRFDIILGYKYAKVNEEYSQSGQSLSLGYHYSNFSAYFYTSNYDINNGESGIDDSSLSFYYRLNKNDFSFSLGAGVYIPTYDSAGNKSDYFVKTRVTRYVGLYDFSIDIGHTFMHDEGTRDTDTFSLSSGYLASEKSYFSISYTNQNSIYEDERNLQSISLYAGYFFNEKLFLSTTISGGLSESATDFSYSLNVGYRF